MIPKDAKYYEAKNKTIQAVMLTRDNVAEVAEWVNTLTGNVYNYGIDSGGYTFLTWYLVSNGVVYNYITAYVGDYIIDMGDSAGLVVLPSWQFEQHYIID